MTEGRTAVVTAALEATERHCVFAEIFVGYRARIASRTARAARSVSASGS